MLKTVFYSIVFFSSFIREIERAKENNEKKKEIKDSDYIFSCVDSQMEVQKIFQKVFNDEDIKVEKKNAFLADSKFISTNGYSVSFDYPLALKLKYEKEVETEEKQSEIEKNIVKIAKEIIKTIKDFNKYKDERIVAYVETRYVLTEQKENASKKMISLLKLNDKEIEKTGIVLIYNNKEDKELKLSIKEKSSTEIEYQAALRIKICEQNTINSILDSKNKEYIETKIRALKI